MTIISPFSKIQSGCDIVHIQRIQYLYTRWGERLVQKILAPQEQDFLPQHNLKKIAFLAKRFAAKEAISKALGVGIGKSLAFHDIVIEKSSLGQPFVQEKNWFSTFQIQNISLSLSDEKDYAIAFCVIVFY